MGSGIINEKWRAEQLREKLQLDMDAYSSEEYPATAIHVNSTIVDANQASVDLYGYSLEELIGMNAWRLFSENVQPRSIHWASGDVFRISLGSLTAM